MGELPSVVMTDSVFSQREMQRRFNDHRIQTRLKHGAITEQVNKLIMQSDAEQIQKGCGTQ